MARIGFAPVDYQASEMDGSIMFMFGVLEGNITFDVNVDFETSDGSAEGMNRPLKFYIRLLIINLLVNIYLNLQLVLTIIEKHHRSLFLARKYSVSQLQ